MENPFRLVSTGFRHVSDVWQGVLELIIVLRAAVTVRNELNIHWNTDGENWLLPQVKGDLCSSFVVVVGVSLTLLYGISLFDCLYWLILARRFILENVRQIRQNVPVLAAVSVCILNAFYYYSFVSETWTQRLSTEFQALHVVPTFIVCYYTISIGLVLCSLNSSQLPAEFRIGMKKHQGANLVLAVYALTNYTVSLTTHANSSIMLISVTLEVACRRYFLYKLDKQLQAEVPPSPRASSSEESSSEEDYPGFADRFMKPIPCWEDIICHCFS